MGSRASFQKNVRRQSMKESRKRGSDMRRRLKPLERMAVTSWFRHIMPSENRVEKSAAKANTRETKRGALKKKYLAEVHRLAPACRRLSILSKKSTMR